MAGHPVLSPALLTDVLNVIRRDPTHQLLVLDDMMYVRMQQWLHNVQALAEHDPRAALLWQRFEHIPFSQHFNPLTGDPEWLLPAEWLQRIKSARYYLIEVASTS